MLKNFVPARQVIHVECYIVFDDAEGNGYAFPCDMSGNLQPMSDEAKTNYEKCMASPDEFVRYNEFVTSKNPYTEAAHGTCLCGADTISEKNSRQNQRRCGILKQGDKNEEIYHNKRRV